MKHFGSWSVAVEEAGLEVPENPMVTTPEVLAVLSTNRLPAFCKKVYEDFKWITPDYDAHTRKLAWSLVQAIGYDGNPFESISRETGVDAKLFNKWLTGKAELGYDDAISVGKYLRNMLV